MKASLFMLFFSAIRAPLSSDTVLRIGGCMASSLSSSISAISDLLSRAFATRLAKDFLLCTDPIEDSLITLSAIDFVSSARTSSFSTSSGTKSTAGSSSTSFACSEAFSLCFVIDKTTTACH